MIYEDERGLSTDRQTGTAATSGGAANMSLCRISAVRVGFLHKFRKVFAAITAFREILCRGKRNNRLTLLRVGQCPVTGRRRFRAAGRTPSTYYAHSANIFTNNLPNSS